jgi:hypothetical protein
MPGFLRLVDDDTTDVWYDIDEFAALAETWDFAVMPSRAVRYSALLTYAESTHAKMEAGARAAMCAAAVDATPVHSMTAYVEWGAKPERARYDSAARERAQGLVDLVACVVLARGRGDARTPLARGLASLPSGLLAMVAATGV